MASKVDVTERIAIPYGVSYEGLLDVIGAWHRAQGYAKPMKTGEVGLQVRSGAKAESKAKLVSNQSSFLAQIGILRRIGQSNQLTETGREVSRLVDQGLAQEFNSSMKRIILDWPQVKPFLKVLRQRGSIPKRELVELIVQESGKSMGTTNATMGATALIALFERVGLMKEERGSFTVSDRITFDESPALPHAETVVTKRPEPIVEPTPAEKGEETVVTEPSMPAIETTPVETAVTEPPQLPAEATAAEEHEEIVVTEPLQPVEEKVPIEIQEEEVVVTEPPQLGEEMAATETREEEVVSEPSEPAVETVPTEEHEEPAVTEAPAPAVEMAPEEKSMSERPQSVEKTGPAEKREETVVNRPAEPTEEASQAKKHEEVEAPRPVAQEESYQMWRFSYSACFCFVFIMVLTVIFFGLPP